MKEEEEEGTALFPFRLKKEDILKHTNFMMKHYQSDIFWFCGLILGCAN